MTLTAKDLKAYADGVRYQIDRCKAICDAPSTSDADFERANSLLSLLPRVAGTARALAYYMGEIENIEAHYENMKMFDGLFGWRKHAA
jgi:hypothetical protein